MKKRLMLITIIIFGFLLRVLFITSSPPSLYGDELTIALDAYSLLKTGHDQLGNFMPLTFPMGAGRPAGYVYFSIPFIAIFGPTALGVRGLSIMSGIGLIILLYLITKKYFSQKVGLVAAAIYAFSPWDISLSRGGFEAHLALFLAVLGIYLLIEASKKPKFYILSAASFGLTLHTYPTYKLSLLLFLPLIFWFTGIRNILDKSKKYLVSFLITLLILVILSLSQTFIGSSETRFASINIFSQDKLKASIEEKINLERNISQLPSSLVKYFHNKSIEYMKVLGENYLQNFSVDFLFIHGDRNPRHNMATMGHLYFVEIILISLGLLSFWQKEKKTLTFLLIWLLLAPLPTAIVDLPHVLRSAFMLPPLIILSSLGFATIASIREKLHLFVILLLFVIQFIFFAQKLFFLAPTEYSNFWSYPAKIASEIAIKNKNEYDYIFLSDRIDAIEFAYPVYAKINPHQVISQNKNRNSLREYYFKKFENIYIGNIPNGNLENFLSNIPGKILYIGDFTDRSYLKAYETQEINPLSTIVLSRRDN